MQQQLASILYYNVAFACRAQDSREGMVLGTSDIAITRELM